MRITRFPSLTEQQFLGGTAAFVDSLFGELSISINPVLWQIGPQVGGRCKRMRHRIARIGDLK